MSTTTQANTKIQTQPMSTTNVHNNQCPLRHKRIEISKHILGKKEKLLAKTNAKCVPYHRNSRFLHEDHVVPFSRLSYSDDRVRFLFEHQERIREYVDSAGHHQRPTQSLRAVWQDAYFLKHQSFHKFGLLSSHGTGYFDEPKFNNNIKRPAAAKAYEAFWKKFQISKKKQSYK